MHACNYTYPELQKMELTEASMHENTFKRKQEKALKLACFWLRRHDLPGTA